MVIVAVIGQFNREAIALKIHLAAAITLIAAASLTLLSRIGEKRRGVVSRREIYFTVTVVWLLLVVFGTLPYLLTGATPSFANAFFESMSGFTTTGSSILVNLELLPKSLHLWRSLTQWIGGIGIIIFMLSFLPLFGGSSRQLYDAEATGIAADRFRPRIKEITKKITLTYISLTAVGFLLLWAGPMDAFDAACHTLSAISTGGFSTYNLSVAAFNSPYSEYILTLIMFMGGTNFLLISSLLTRFSLSAFRDEQFRWYSSIIAVFTVIITIGLLMGVGTAGTGTEVAVEEVVTAGGAGVKGFEESFRTALFQVVAAVTSTGLATADFVAWGPFYWHLFLIMILFCACEGSTSGGMKVSRLIVLAKNSLLVFKRQVHPNAIYMVRIDGKPISNEAISRVTSFTFIYLAITIFVALLLTLNGVGFNESISLSLSSISNWGPGFGSFRPGGNFAALPNLAKYLLTFLMLVGRLEIFTVLSLFIPGFWKR